MEQDPASLLQTLEQWPLWSDVDSPFADYVTANELQAHALQNHEAIMSDPYCSQPTPDVMLANSPSSAPPGFPAVRDLGVGLGWWCMDLIAEDSNSMTSYGGWNGYNPYSCSATKEIAEPPRLPLLDDSALVSAPLITTTQPLRISHKSSNPPPPAKEAVAGPSILQASAQALIDWGPGKKRSHSVIPNVSPSSDTAGGPTPSGPPILAH
ncbi:hypothetical protein CTA2_2862 [Colletotrichum tanaceti]|uniref:Uncharacterized protein n=1 Tax=Colletotrichum tanaceti TaxID=1306861 RepID=A0A4U6X301_9PEZI|nr:hypothetical protein CTA2_2862 [Colletotrichum tanaceti]TKW49283.1 hypothetical protein CTA1_546 [Colletotrichum tanaceti]